MRGWQWHASWYARRCVCRLIKRRARELSLFGRCTIDRCSRACRPGFVRCRSGRTELISSVGCTSHRTGQQCRGQRCRSPKVQRNRGQHQC